MFVMKTGPVEEFEIRALQTLPLATSLPSGWLVDLGGRRSPRRRSWRSQPTNVCLITLEGAQQYPLMTTF